MANRELMMGNIVRAVRESGLVPAFRAGAEAPSLKGLNAALKGRSSTEW